MSIIAYEKLPSFLRSLRYRNYRLFFAGQIISLTGTSLQMVAQAWLIYRLTGSATMLGLLGFAAHIPMSVLAPIGGIVTDRYNRHGIIIATQITSMFLAFALAALTLTGLIQAWHVIVFAALLGFVNVFDIPARQAFLVDMVGKRDLINAIAWNSSMFNSARIIGPAIAGILVIIIGEGWCFFINAVSYIAIIIGLLLMSFVTQARVPLPGSGLSGIMEGFRYAWNTGSVRALLLLVGIVSFMGMSYGVLMPIFADQILHGGPKGLGLLMGAIGVGALSGALTLAARRGVHGLERWVTLAPIGFGLSLILFSLSRSFWLSALLLLPAGFSVVIQISSSNTLIQTIVPDNLRGRVMAVFAMMFMGIAPFGALLAGALAERLGAPITVTIGGTACIAGALVFGLRLPVLRRTIK